MPQQPNGFDCGVYLLHYVELFAKQAPSHFKLDKDQGFPYFVSVISNFFVTIAQSAMDSFVSCMKLDNVLDDERLV